MSNITAKVICNSKTESGEGDQRRAALQFYADYADGRNKAWAAATPTLSLTMTVKGPVADEFTQGGHYTLTFTPEPEPEAGTGG